MKEGGAAARDMNAVTVASLNVSISIEAMKSL